MTELRFDFGDWFSMNEYVPIMEMIPFENAVSIISPQSVANKQYILKYRSQIDIEIILLGALITLMEDIILASHITDAKGGDIESDFRKLI